MVEKIDFESAEKQNNYSDFSDDELSPSFVKMPNVGEETGFMKVLDFKKNMNHERKDKNGNKFSVALSGVDHAVELITDKGTCTINSWEVFGKLKTGFMKLASEQSKSFYDIVRKSDLEVNIIHVYDGMSRDAEVQKAKKEKRLYSVLFKFSGKTRELLNGEWIEQ